MKRELTLQTLRSFNALISPTLRRVFPCPSSCVAIDSITEPVDATKPTLPIRYTYRDWVIASFNSDRPFDKFVIAQIAADQIDDKTCRPRPASSRSAAAFSTCQPDIINDRIDVVSRGLLGLTVACARCHDHKFDPISAADYYALYGVFASASEKPRDDAPPQLVDNPTPFDPVRLPPRRPRQPRPQSRSPIPHRSCRPITNRSHSNTAAAAANWPTPSPAATIRSPPACGSTASGTICSAAASSTRPATSAVRGTPPTHPELLDTLACELMDDGWSTKHLIRRIVMSATYRQQYDESVSATTSPIARAGSR